MHLDALGSGGGGGVLLSAQTSQYVGWIVLILSGASFCILLDSTHGILNPTMLSSFWVVWGQEQEDLCRLGSPN